MTETVYTRLLDLVGEDKSGRRVVKLEPPIKTHDVDPISAMYAYATFEPEFGRFALRFFASDAFPEEYVIHYVPGPHVRDDTIFEIAEFGK